MSNNVLDQLASISNQTKSFANKFLTPAIAKIEQFSGSDKQVLYSEFDRITDLIPSARDASPPFHGQMDKLTGQVAYAGNEQWVDYFKACCSDLKKDFLDAVKDNLERKTVVNLKKGPLERSIYKGLYTETLKNVFVDGGFQDKVKDIIMNRDFRSNAQVYNLPQNIKAIAKDFKSTALAIFDNGLETANQKYNPSYISEKANIDSFINDVRKLGTEYKELEKAQGNQNTESTLGGGMFRTMRGGSYRDALLNNVASEIEYKLDKGVHLNTKLINDAFKTSIRDLGQNTPDNTTRNHNQLNTDSEKSIREMRDAVKGVLGKYLTASIENTNVHAEVHTR